jgi:hypothetical protein
MDLPDRPHLLALTARGHSLLDRIAGDSGEGREGSETVSELEKIIRELRRLYPATPLQGFKADPHDR